MIRLGEATAGRLHTGEPCAVEEEEDVSMCQAGGSGKAPPGIGHNDGMDDKEIVRESDIRDPACEGSWDDMGIFVPKPLEYNGILASQHMSLAQEAASKIQDCHESPEPPEPSESTVETWVENDPAMSMEAAEKKLGEVKSRGLEVIREMEAAKELYVTTSAEYAEHMAREVENARRQVAVSSQTLEELEKKRSSFVGNMHRR